jgi:hypothetical protein
MTKIQISNKTIFITIISIVVITGIIIGLVILLKNNSNTKPKKQLFGNWYYWWGTTCTPGVQGQSVDCPVLLEDYLKPLGIKPNTSFYLGTGAYENSNLNLTQEEANCTVPSSGTCGNSTCWFFGKWDCVKQDQKNVSWYGQKIDIPNQIINFGGYGCCPKSTDTTGQKLCPNSPSLPNNYCNTPTYDQPNVVWTNDLFGNLPSAEQILNRGYTGVSIDIEGYHPEDNNAHPIQLKNKLREWKSANLDTIITVPGNGVNSKFGGMEWFSFLAEDPNLDFICVMYYAKINDTEKKGAGELISTEKLRLSLLENWSGPSSRFKLKPEQIILGFSFGKITSPDEFLSPEAGIWPNLACGGVTRWVEQGGNLSHCSGSLELCGPQPPFKTS